MVIFEAVRTLSLMHQLTTAFPSDEEFHPTLPSVPVSDTSLVPPPPSLPQQDSALPVSVLPSEQAPDIIPPVRRVRQPPIFKENIDPDAVYWYSIHMSILYKWSRLPTLVYQ